MVKKLKLDRGRLVEWLGPELIEEVRGVFEPRYGGKLGDDEVVMMANNLVGVMETIFKFEWRMGYAR